MRLTRGREGSTCIKSAAAATGSARAERKGMSLRWPWPWKENDHTSADESTKGASNSPLSFREEEQENNAQETRMSDWYAYMEREQFAMFAVASLSPEKLDDEEYRNERLESWRRKAVDLTLEPTKDELVEVYRQRRRAVLDDLRRYDAERYFTE